MKFRKDLIFDGIENARSFYCHIYPGKNHECGTCGLYSQNNGRTLMCHAFCKDFPHDAAKIMGYEVIGDEADALEISTDVGSMTLAQAKDYCLAHVRTGCYNDGKCELSNKNICKKYVSGWNFRSALLTPQELEICMSLGAKWVTRAEAGLYTELWSVTPMKRRDDEGRVYFVACGIGPIANTDHSLFPSIKPGDCINVEELLNGT